MRRYERIIRNRIDLLTVDKIATQVSLLKHDIQFFYWMGKMSTKKYNQLMYELEKKRSNILNAYFDKVALDYDKHLENIIKGM